MIRRTISDGSKSNGSVLSTEAIVSLLITFSVMMECQKAKYENVQERGRGDSGNSRKM